MLNFIKVLTYTYDTHTYLGLKLQEEVKAFFAKIDIMKALNTKYN